MKISHLLFGHRWQQIDYFKYAERRVIFPFQEGYYFYKCECGAYSAKHPNEAVVIAL